MLKDWDHQIRSFDAVQAAIAAGQRRICLQSPTGTGKTRIAAKLIKRWLDTANRVVLYTNRRLLLDQSSDVYADLDLLHGIRAAGRKGDSDFAFQISSIQTETSRVIKRKTHTLHDATRVVIDEAHLQKSEDVQRIINKHVEAGAVLLGTTATPVDIGHIYRHLIRGCTLQEGRECGALVLAQTFGPDEPDMRKLKKKPTEGEDFSESQQRQAMMTPTLFGRVWDWFEKLNPDHLPTILFAPGVRESIWFAEQFVKKGVTAAHIDGSNVSFGEVDSEGNSVVHRVTDKLREQVLAGSRDGSIRVLTNRFVLREGIDCPWLRHIVVATIFGSLQTYLQSLGRGGRNDHGEDTVAKWGPKTHVTIQDHGGNWHRHGSVNADRHWELEFTAAMVYGLRADAIRRGEQKKPRRCPQCARIVTFYRCPCGFEFKNVVTSKPVVTADGSYREMPDDCFVPRRVCKASNARAEWVSQYWRSYNAGRTFKAGMALYAREHYFGYPDESWSYMPRDPVDFYRRVKDVHWRQLILTEEEIAKIEASILAKANAAAERELFA